MYYSELLCLCVFFSVGELMFFYTAEQVCISVYSYGLQEYAGVYRRFLCVV